MNTINNTFFGLIGFIFGILTSFFLQENEFLRPLFIAVFAGVGSALITFFFDFITAPGQIFGFYSRFVESLHKSEIKFFQILSKPVGGCIFCANVWFTFVTFLICRYHFGLSFWFLIPAAAISHVFLAYLDKNLNS
jgi:hypothetical protein